VLAQEAIKALNVFSGVKRRLEVRGEENGITVYDDFAHHPTAIATTLEGLRRRVGNARIIAILEPRSNTMRMGVHRDALAPSFALADQVFLYGPPDLGWDLEAVARASGGKAVVHTEIASIVNAVAAMAQPGDHLLVMSNGGFGGIHEKLLRALHERNAA